jgi:D-alanyl-D-alanine carboxypeptidase (penicillin-binding protein 5/6)
LLAARGLEVAARDDERIAVQVEAPDEVEGPIASGARLGTATVTLDGEAVGRLPLRAARSIDEASTMQRFDAAIPGPRAAAVLFALAVLGLACLALAALLRRLRGRSE